VTWPSLLVGAIAAILLGAGLIPPYFELWKRDGRVIGISGYSILWREDVRLTLARLGLLVY
jgi:hypothetical protein